MASTQNISEWRYSVRCQQHHRSILQALEAMCRDGDLVDVSLWCEGRRIRAHKALLAACSPYFKTVFKENPSQHPDIIFHNVRYSDLAAIVEYIYHGELMIAHDQLMSFLHTAKTLSIRGLVDASKEPQPPQHSVWSSSSTSQQQNLILTSPMLSEKNNVTQYPTSSSVSLDHQQQPTIAEMQAAPQLRQQEQTPLLSHQVQDEVQQLPQDIQQEQESQQLMQEMDVQTQQECQEQIMQCNTMQTVQTMETIEANPQEPTNEIVGATRTTLTDEIREQHNSENSNLDEERSRWFVRSDQKKFKCGFCEKAYSNKNTLKNHHNNVHSGRTMCSICGRVLCRISVLQMHMRKIHKITI